MSGRIQKNATDAERDLIGHLQRASELLQQNDVDGASDEVLRALTLRGDDARAKNLLGLVRFRGGRFSEALAIFSDLVDDDPQEPSLRLNLALVELKLGRAREAAENLRQVVAREPGNVRAFSYLGNALVELGALPEARDAFARAGQTDMVRTVEERLANPALRDVPLEEALWGKQTERAPSPSSPAAKGAAALRAIADAGGELPAPPLVADSIDAAARGAAARLAFASPTPPPATRSSEGSVVLSEFAASHLLAPPLEAMALRNDRQLVVRVDDRVAVRQDRAVAASGVLRFESVLRRARGATSDEPMADGAFAWAVGTGLVLLSGERLATLLLSDDVLYVRETALLAFEPTLLWENGRLPGADLPIVQLRGRGRCALEVHPSLFAMRLAGNQTLRTAPTALFGWMGRVVPRTVDATSLTIECSGEGVVLLDGPR